MTKQEMDACLVYIARSKGHRRYKGWADCRICEERLGDQDLITSDGRWIFPEGFDHYIKKHAVRPPRDKFIQDAIKYSDKVKERERLKQRPKEKTRTYIWGVWGISFWKGNAHSDVRSGGHSGKPVAFIKFEVPCCGGTNRSKERKYYRIACRNWIEKGIIPNDAELGD
jgi:hypothetical protein